MATADGRPQIRGAELVGGRYELIDPIGAGGTGTVWRAFDRTRETYCAAKVLRRREAGQLLRFAREQSVRLTHPHIVAPYAWVADDDTVLIASELVDGGSLHTLLGDYGPLADATICVVLDQVLDALDAVHRAALIHRDVTPGNVLLRATGYGPVDVLLGDFGLTISTKDPRLTAAGMVVGTPGYIAPELLAGLSAPHPRHDIYAAGRLAVTMAVGYETDELAVDLDSFQDPALAAAVRAMVAVDPADRPADAAAARLLLAGAARSTRPLTRDGEPVLVHVQLPGLSAGAVGKDAVLQGLSAATRRDTVVLDTPPPDSPRTTQAVPQSMHPATSAAPVTRSVVRRRPLVIAAGIGLIVAVTLLVAVLSKRSQPPSTGTEPPVTSSTEPPANSSTEPQNSPATVANPPVAGEICSWQQQGNQLAGLICTLTAGGYVWTAA